jgi:hypothetical protein
MKVMIFCWVEKGKCILVTQTSNSHGIDAAVSRAFVEHWAKFFLHGFRM